MRRVHLLEGLWKAFCLRGRPVFRRRIRKPYSLERLEDRTLLSNIVVTTTADTVDSLDGVISLREALAQAEGSAADDTITFSSSILDGSGKATINLTESLNQLEFNGSSAGALTINGDVDGDGTADITIDANRTSANGDSNTRVFYATNATSLTLEGLGFREGFASAGGQYGANVQIDATADGGVAIIDCTSTSSSGGTLQSILRMQMHLLFKSQEVLFPPM